MPAEKSAAPKKATTKKAAVPKATKKATKKATTKKATGKKSAPKKERGKAVAQITTEVALIKRYCALHGKTTDVARNAATALLRALQKAINERKIRKTSKYADEVMNMQRGLIAVVNSGKSETIQISGIDQLRKIAASQHRKAASKTMAKLISLINSNPSKEVAAEILAKAKKLIKTKQQQAALEALQRYVDGKTPWIMATEAQLQGLAGLDNGNYTDGECIDYANSEDKVKYVVELGDGSMRCFFKKNSMIKYLQENGLRYEYLPDYVTIWEFETPKTVKAAKRVIGA